MLNRQRVLMVVLVIVAVVSVSYALAPNIVANINQWIYDVQKTDDATNYDTLKQVEDSCRAMIASYEADKLVYEQYCDSQSDEQHSWAMQAMMRANKTAATYNEYVLRNAFVWAENVPNDIRTELEIIREN